MLGKGEWDNNIAEWVLGEGESGGIEEQELAVQALW
jgi:hypothetical protein